MNEIHQKLSVWAKLNKQWLTMESNLRSIKTHPTATGPSAQGLCPMEIELRALRAKVDTAFNEASAAIHRQPGPGRGGSTTGAGPRSEHGR